METSKETLRDAVKNKRSPNNLIKVPVTSKKDFFKWWCIFLRPFVNLTNREIDVVSSFLKQRWELSKIVSDPAILDAMVMSDDTKKKVMEECNITLQHFYVVMSNLRKHKVLKGTIINPRLIPNIRETDNDCFELRIIFKQEETK